MANIIATTLRAPETLLARLKQSAKEQGHTLNALILQILWEWAERQTKEKGEASNGKKEKPSICGNR